MSGPGEGGLVSVIVPTYNRAADLRRALTSLIDQTVPNWEAIVVDNNSTDDTDAVVRKFGDHRIRLTKIENHGIIAASRNRGISLARGEFVAFLDSDDWWTPDKLRYCLATFRAGADFVYHDMFVCRDHVPSHPVRSGSVRAVTRPVRRDLLENGNAIINSGAAVRRAVLDSVGAMSEDPQLVGAEDFDLWLRIAKVTDRFSMLDHVLGFYWVGTSNMTNPVRTVTSFRSLLARYADEPDLQKAYWPAYAMGRAYFRSGSFRKANQELRDRRMTRANFSLKLRSAFMRAVCIARISLGSD